MHETSVEILVSLFVISIFFLFVRVKRKIQRFIDIEHVYISEKNRKVTMVVFVSSVCLFAVLLLSYWFNRQYEYAVRSDFVSYIHAHNWKIDHLRDD